MTNNGTRIIKRLLYLSEKWPKETGQRKARIENQFSELIKELSWIKGITQEEALCIVREKIANKKHPTAIGRLTK